MTDWELIRNIFKMTDADLFNCMLSLEKHEIRMNYDLLNLFSRD